MFWSGRYGKGLVVIKDTWYTYVGAGEMLGGLIGLVVFLLFVWKGKR